MRCDPSSVALGSPTSPSPPPRVSPGRPGTHTTLPAPLRAPGSTGNAAAGSGLSTDARPCGAAAGCAGKEEQMTTHAVGRTGGDVRVHHALSVHWAWFAGGLVVAFAVPYLLAAVLAAMVVRTEDATSRPDGLELAAAVAWRGIVYGVTDGLLLSVFPILVVFAAFAGTRLDRRLSGKVVIGIVALAASLTMTAVYHAGYGEFRSEKIRKPLTGD